MTDKINFGDSTILKPIKALFEVLIGGYRTTQKPAHYNVLCYRLDDNESAHSIFMRKREDLIQYLKSSNLPRIAKKLYKMSIISNEALDEALNSKNTRTFRTLSLLNVVDNKIRVDPHTYDEFMRTLDSELTLRKEKLNK